MPEEVPVFRVDLGPVDVFLAASDFSAAAALSRSRVVEEGERRQLLLKGERYECRSLEPALAALFNVTEPREVSESTAFLCRRPGQPSLAYVVDREFEMQSHPLGEFRLLPACLRAGQARRGIVALRFGPGGRIQFLVNVAQLALGGAEGGGPSRSS